MKHLSIAILVCLHFYNVIPPKAQCSDLELVESDEMIRVNLGGLPVLRYIKKSLPVPNGIPQHYSRSGYIHPVYTPTGQELTGDYPSDHAHQHALFFAWVKSNFKGRKVDFWNQAKGLGRVEFREVISLMREEQKVGFEVKHAFMAKDGEQWLDVLHEHWTVIVHQTPSEYFLFDITSVQECVSENPLSLAEYHYGGMAFRGNQQWLKQKEDDNLQSGDLQFLTSEGLDRWKGNHTRPNWVAMTGAIDGQEVSAAVFCHSKNFRAPQPVRLHPNKPYFCFAPMVQGPFRIEPGEPFVSRYRYLVTSKAADVDEIQQHWIRYTHSED